MRTSPWTKRRWIQYRKRMHYSNPEKPIDPNEYAARWRNKNRKHLRAYSRHRYHKVWGRSNRRRGYEAEKLAVEIILPKLGFAEICHVTPIRKMIPFDIVATYKGQRVIIDVTTGRCKATTFKSAIELAVALRLHFFILFVKPDFSAYMLREALSGMKSIQAHLKELVPIAK